MFKLGLFAVIAAVAQGAYAHPGSTDSMGCHTNKQTGEYHCHQKYNHPSDTLGHVPKILPVVDKAPLKTATPKRS